MNVEQTIKAIIADIKKTDISSVEFLPDTNFIEKVSLDSFEVVNFVDRLDKTFKINFGTEPEDFDSLKSWSALLANLQNKLIA